MTAPLSPEGYAATGGRVCPCCGAGRLAGDLYQARAAWTLTQAVTCRACHATWTAVYTLSGYEDLAVPEEETPDA